MKKIFLIAVAALFCVPVIAQELTKEEKSALKSQIKAEKKIYKDSVRAAIAEERRIADSLTRAKARQEEQLLQEERRKSKATALVIVTPFDSQENVFDMLVHRMIQDGNVPAAIDKDYFIIRSARKQVSVGTYDITYSIFKKNNKVHIRAAGFGYGNISFGYGSEREMIVPLEYGGTTSSVAGAAWAEIKKYLLNITHEEAIYELQ